MTEQAIWNPPYPFIAKILPSERSFPASRTGSLASTGSPCMLSGKLLVRRGASHSLGVKPPVSRVIVLSLAKTAKRKLSHSGVFAVVRQPLDNSETRPTVGAGDKKVLVPWVFGVPKLGEAFVANSDAGGMIEPESSASSELFQIVNSLNWFAPES